VGGGGAAPAAEALTGRALYAIGGALALGIHGALRATRDIDLNVFCTPEALGAAIDALAEEGVQLPVTARREADEVGWFSGWLGEIRVDVFVPSIEFSWEAARRRVLRPFAGESLWFLSAESLAVFKLLFFRTKDLADLERLCRTTPTLDRAWVREQVASMLGLDDPRIAAWDRLSPPADGGAPVSPERAAAPRARAALRGPDRA